MMNIVKNERGSMVLLTAWTLTIVGLMLILVLNIAKIYVTKEQAALAAEQASIAASNVIVEEVRRIVDHYKEEDAPDGGYHMIYMKDLTRSILNALAPFQKPNDVRTDVLPSKFLTMERTTIALLYSLNILTVGTMSPCKLVAPSFT